MSQATVEERDTRRPQSQSVSPDVISDFSAPITPLSESQLDGSSTSAAERAASEGKDTSSLEGEADGSASAKRAAGGIDASFPLEGEADPASSAESAAVEGEDSSFPRLEGEFDTGSSAERATERTDCSPSRLESETDGFSTEERKNSSSPRLEGETGDGSSSEVGSDAEVSSSSQAPPTDADVSPLLLASSEEGSCLDSGGDSLSQLTPGTGGFSGAGSDAEGSPRHSQEIKESPITQPAPDAADSTDQLVDVQEKPDAEVTLLSADLSTAARQSPDPTASSQPASETTESSPHAPDVKKDPAQPAPDVGIADHPLAHVNDEPTDAEISQTAPSSLKTTFPPPPAAETSTTPPQQSSDAKWRREKVVPPLETTERSSNDTPDVNGSAQLSLGTAACSEPAADDDDDTPLLTRSTGDNESCPPSPTTRTTTTTTTNHNNFSRALRSRFRARPVSISIPGEGDCSCLSLKRAKRMATSLEDITSLRLWKGIIAEFVGVLLLVLVGCGSCVSLKEGGSSSTVQIALCFGLSVATIVWNIGHISGGHINPAVTLALLATRKISLAKAVFFVLFQLVGAVVGAGILMGLTPKEFQGGLGNTQVNAGLDPGKGLGVELFISFVLVFTVFASIDSKRRDLNGSTPLTIGLSVTMCHLFAIQYTGASMNTARSFGPALVTGKWDNHWVYWVGPIGGGVLAGLLYEYLFAVNASLNKVRACVLSSDYDEDKFKAKKIKVRIVEEDPEAPEEGDGESLPLTRSDGKVAADIEDPTA